MFQQLILQLCLRSGAHQTFVAAIHRWPNNNTLASASGSHESFSRLGSPSTRLTSSSRPCSTLYEGRSFSQRYSAVFETMFLCLVGSIYGSPSSCFFVQCIFSLTMLLLNCTQFKASSWSICFMLPATKRMVPLILVALPQLSCWAY